MFLANFLIALREGLEAALVVGIIAAYLIKSGHRAALRQMWVGVGLVVLAALAFGAVLTFGPKTLTFQAQEIIGGTLSLVAAAMITWMVLWMAQHSRDLKRSLEGQLAGSLEKDGGQGVVWIAVVAVGREGMETSLFVWATVRSAYEHRVSLTVLGLASGFAVAIVVGYLIYRGAVRINLRRFFLVTGYLLVLVAAGIVSYGIGDLQEAGVLPRLSTHAWDLSHLLPDQGSPLRWLWVVGEATFQVNLQPTVLQVIGWWAYLVPVATLFHLRSRQRPAATPTKEHVPS